MALAIGFTSIVAGPVGAVVCDNPDKLCKGDPCEIASTFLSSPCVVDFGERQVVVNGALHTSDNGLISISGGSIVVRKPIIGRRAQASTAFGGRVELHALGDIEVLWRIDVSGRFKAGSILLDAGGDVELKAPLRASASGIASDAVGGLIEIRAGGRVTSVNRARLKVRGARHTVGGRIDVAGGSGVSLKGRLDAVGGSGGRILLSSSGGDVVTTQRLDANGRSGAGGIVVLASAAATTLNTRRIDANGKTRGGLIALTGVLAQTGDVVRARGTGPGGMGGTVLLFGRSTVVVGNTVLVDGRAGGLVSVYSGSSLQASGAILATGKTAAGGDVALASGGQMTLQSTVSSGGRDDGGAITVDAGSLRIDRRSRLLAQGSDGGMISIAAIDARVESGADVRADGEVGSGSIRIDTDGNLVLGGEFRASGGGTIEARARDGSIVADGNFRTSASGCIAIDAGGAVDVSGASFDVAVQATCP